MAGGANHGRKAGANQISEGIGKRAAATLAIGPPYSMTCYPNGVTRRPMGKLQPQATLIGTAGGACMGQGMAATFTRLTEAGPEGHSRGPASGRGSGGVRQLPRPLHVTVETIDETLPGPSWRFHLLI